MVTENSPQVLQVSKKEIWETFVQKWREETYGDLGQINGDYLLWIVKEVSWEPARTAYYQLAWKGADWSDERLLGFLEGVAVSSPGVPEDRGGPCYLIQVKNSIPTLWREVLQVSDETLYELVD